MDAQARQSCDALLTTLARVGSQEGVEGGCGGRQEHETSTDIRAEVAQAVRVAGSALHTLTTGPLQQAPYTYTASAEGQDVRTQCVLWILLLAATFICFDCNPAWLRCQVPACIGKLALSPAAMAAPVIAEGVVGARECGVAGSIVQPAHPRN